MSIEVKIALALAVVMTPTVAYAASGGAQELVGYNALKLTAEQQRSIYRGVGNVPEVPPPEHYLIHVGGQVPASMPLKPLPPAATVQAPQLKTDSYVKLAQGQLLLVRPQDRTIVEIIDRYHGTAGGPAG